MYCSRTIEILPWRFTREHALQAKLNNAWVPVMFKFIDV